jgi:von Hippel-Lindau disease tumor supressor
MRIVRAAIALLALMLGVPAEAREKACRGEGTIRSLNSDVSTTARFANRSAEVVTVYWLDFAGERVRYKTLLPGESYTQQTYLTHPWVVVKKGGECRGPFLPRRKPRTIVTQ